MSLLLHKILAGKVLKLSTEERFRCITIAIAELYSIARNAG